jgi:hypothetical protein
MKMHEINSSHISHVGYDGETMHDTYKGGKTYVYPGCSCEQFDALIASESKGKHLRTMGLKHSHTLEDK